MATKGAAQESTLKSWGRWFVGSKKQQTASQLQYEVMLSECKLLAACVQFLSEGLMEKVKVGSMTVFEEKKKHLSRHDTRSMNASLG